MNRERLGVLSRFIRSQAHLTDRHPHVPGPGEVKLNHAEAIEVANALDQLLAPSFMHSVEPWLLECFGDVVTYDKVERGHRFIEESLELAQAGGMSAAEAHMLVDYVFGRPIGYLPQEIGGVMVTLAALCLAWGENMHTEGETELARVWGEIEAIRAKQAGKPRGSPLPGPS